MITGSNQSKALFWPVALSLLLVIIFFTPLRSNDLWWHLDSGRWMLQHGEYLGHELRSFSIPGTEWPNFSWFFQVVLAAVESVGGLWGLLLLKALLMWLTLFLLFRSISTSIIPLAFVLAVLLLSWRIFPYLYLRPHLFEAVFLASAILLFHRSRSARDPLWYALLIVLWANNHASAVVGAAALALHYVIGPGFNIQSRKTLLHRIPIGLLLWSLVFATPNGLGILDVLFRHAGGDYLHLYIREWLAPDFLHPLMFLALIACITLAIVQRGVLVPAEIMLILLFLLLVEHSRRFQFELALLLIRPTSILVGTWIAWFVKRCGLTRVYWSWLYALLLMAMLVAVYPSPVYWSRLQIADFPLQQGRFPHVAMAVLQPLLEHETEIRVLNDYGWGGYVGFWGGGKIKVYIDGRTPTVFSEELMLNEILALKRPRFLRDLSRRWQVDAILLRRGQRLPFPVGDPEWELVACDSISMLYLRTGLARQYQLPGLKFDPLQQWPKVAAGQVDQAIASLHWLLAQDSNNDLAWLRLGQLLGYYKSQQGVTYPRQAMQALQKATQLNPGNIIAQLTLAHLRQQEGEDHQAVAQPLLALLDSSDKKALSGYEVEMAKLLQKTGHFAQVIDVLSPESWTRHQQLDEDFKVWLLRMAAHAGMGDQQSAEFDRRMAGQMALDAGPSASQQLQMIEESIK